MDSLTQLTLGAAVGQLIAGKKLGNKAIIWGALVGTIPDLDVITSIWMDDIESLAFHRGITHSILFSVLAPLVFAYLAQLYYRSKIHDHQGYNKMWRGLWFILGGTLIAGTAFTVILSLNLVSGIGFIFFSALGVLWIRQAWNNKSSDFEEISYWRWYVLFLLGFVTHVLIDAFTTYGTQIFQPFSNVRFTTSTISVVDPIYTVPLLLGITIASLYKRSDKKRRQWNRLGLFVSSLYMVFTFGNKMNINSKFESRLDELGYNSSRMMTNPTIFNNILWHGIAETDSNYIEGYYSLLDDVDPFEDIRVIPKNRDIIKSIECEEGLDLKTLQWFSDGYYNYRKINGVTYYNDLRFGSVWQDESQNQGGMIFYFRIDENCEAKEIRDFDKVSEYLPIFFKRMRGE